jgi:hypothetical protein
MRDNDLISRRRDWLTARVDEDLIMMSAASKYFLSLSGSGCRIWELLETPRTIVWLCQTLVREYVVEAEAARSQVTAFLERMHQLNAIDVNPGQVA